MKISNIRKLMSLAVLAVLAACTADEAVEKEEGGVNPDGTVTQNIQFFISGSASPSDILTRDVPPGVNPGLEDMAEGIPGCNVDRIRLLTFRRMEGTDDSFVYDAGNSTDGTDAHPDLTATAMAFTAEDGATISKEYGRGAKGAIKKEKGYEYRVIAIGYDCDRQITYPKSNSNSNLFPSQEINESSLFKIVDEVSLTNNADNPVLGSITDGESRFEDISLQVVPKSFEEEAGYITSNSGVNPPGVSGDKRKNLTGWYQVTPEIFYGTCYSSGSKSEIIKFSDENKLTGYLYRGVAKLTVKVYNIQNLTSQGGAGVTHTCAISLLADSVRQAVKLTDYDDFKTPFYLYDNTSQHNLPNFGANNSDDPKHTFTAIAIDGKIEGDDIAPKECHFYNNANDIVELETYLLPTQTRLYFRYRCAYEGDGHLLHNAEYKMGDILLNVQNKSDGMQATGVIDPISGGEFVYFRRNQRYDLNIDCSVIENNYDDLRVK